MLQIAALYMPTTKIKFYVYQISHLPDLKMSFFICSWNIKIDTIFAEKF